MGLYAAGAGFIREGPGDAFAEVWLGRGWGEGVKEGPQSED